MRPFSKLRTALLITMMAAPLSAQRHPMPPAPAAATEKRMTLVVNDRSAPNAVVSIDGRSYVDLEALARVTNASVNIQPDRIVVNLPVTSAETPTQELSKPFVRAAIVHLAKARAWRQAIAVVIQLGVPAGSWPDDYRGQTRESLTLAGLAATTPSDLKALGLLQNDLANLEQWDNTTVTNRATMVANQSIDPNALQNDTLLAKISGCQDFLSTMLVSGVFTDDPSCR